nr:phospholipase A1-II 1-like [Ipomoea batatas]
MYTTTTDKDDGKSPRDEIREEVARLVELYKDEEVSITVIGHSLGSSMATLNAVDLAANPININKDILVTAFLYASPKVGDENFKNAFSNQPNLRALRISDVNDKIPTLPLIGWKEGEHIDSSKPYEDVGVGLVIESKKSEYLKPEVPNLLTHDLMLYMHGIDLYQTSKGNFERIGDFDLPKVNKYQDALNDNSEKLNVEGSTVTLTPSGERISTVYDELASPTFVTVLVYVCDPDVDVVTLRRKMRLTCLSVYPNPHNSNCKDVSWEAPFVFDFVVPEDTQVEAIPEKNHQADKLIAHLLRPRFQDEPLPPHFYQPWRLPRTPTPYTTDLIHSQVGPWRDSRGRAIIASIDISTVYEVPTSGAGRVCPVSINVIERSGLVSTQKPLPSNELVVTIKTVTCPLPLSRWRGHPVVTKRGVFGENSPVQQPNDHAFAIVGAVPEP